MGCYFTLCHDTYGYSLLFYKVYMKRENAGGWNSRLEKEQILETPCLVGPLAAFRWPSSTIWNLLSWKKITSKLSGWNTAATRRNLGGTNLGLRQSCSAGDTSLREGKIITTVITNAPLIGRGQSPSTSSSAWSHLQTLVHLLYPILVSTSGIGASRLLVVLITPSNWC